MKVRKTRTVEFFFSDAEAKDKFLKVLYAEGKNPFDGIALFMSGDVKFEDDYPEDHFVTKEAK